MQQERLTAHYRKHLVDIFQAALVRVEGRNAVSDWLMRHPLSGPVELIAIGKAAQSMACGAHDRLGGRIERALIISKTGHVDFLFCRRHGWEALESAHPLPDRTSLQAGRRLLGFVSERADRPLLFLISGGASSLVEAPVEGVDLSFLIRANDWLLGSGFDITQMNGVRKALSRIKGGGLLQWLGERQIRALAISDVPGDLPRVIGSGLLTPEPDLPRQLASLALPPWLDERLSEGLRQRAGVDRSPPAVEIVATLKNAMEAAAQRAGELGFPVCLQRDRLQGDAAVTGQRLARSLLHGPSGVVIWGGETQVKLPPDPGQGGRNQHLALAAARELAGSPDCYLLAAGTDGTDGPTEDAGALVDGGTIARAELEGFEADRSLAAADAGRLLEASGDLITTGPTGTNVMDLVIGLRR
ncbi:MAG: DUF4147 domain-containing protein [Candidatus Thiodiazotropha sp. (ex Dulcina madagascariensis)]|nr:DUF4147 domain-containing protein [Candidatus Thiodiazotropha sp. (ex Dulcina madagascariensis)]